jgi:hypothetical protein
MNLQQQLQLSDEHYALLFDVRRSIRYHGRRQAFYEQLHHLTSLLTILLAGSVLFDLAKKGDTADWLIWVSVVAAMLAAVDMVIGYSTHASLHSSLRERFANLEIAIISGPADGDCWLGYQKERLLIEKDEPAIYLVLDGLCRNELLIAEGFSKKDTPEYFFTSSRWRRWTAQLLR